VARSPSASDLDARARDIVERTTREQGLTLAITDPVALHQVAVLVLEAGGRS
jgi:hypothetical protein